MIAEDLILCHQLGLSIDLDEDLISLRRLNPPDVETQSAPERHADRLRLRRVGVFHQYAIIHKEHGKVGDLDMSIGKGGTDTSHGHIDWLGIQKPFRGSPGIALGAIRALRVLHPKVKTLTANRVSGKKQGLHRKWSMGKAPTKYKKPGFDPDAQLRAAGPGW